jgi:hypothetical protein
MKNTRGLIGLVLVATMLVAGVAEAMHGTDIVLTSGSLGSRLHSARYRDGWRSYDVNSDGTGVIIFYRRAESVPGGYPRGAVLESWVYQLTDEPFNTGDASAADSVSVIVSGGDATKVIVRPIK